MQLMHEQGIDDPEGWRFSHRGIPVLEVDDAPIGTLVAVCAGDLPEAVGAEGFESM